MTQDDFHRALEKEVAAAGSQTALAEKLGMRQSQISDYLRGRFPVEGMTVGNLFKLFPHAIINLVGLPDKEVEPVKRSMEEQYIAIFRDLPPEDQVRCFAMVAANFGERIGEDGVKNRIGSKRRKNFE